jgi:hypothetical protein
MDIRKNCDNTRDEDVGRILPEVGNRDENEKYFRW